MTRTGSDTIRAKMADCPPEFRHDLEGAIQFFKLEHPEANSWDDDRVIEEILWSLAREKNPLFTPIGRDSDGTMIFRWRSPNENLQEAIRLFRLDYPQANAWDDSKVIEEMLLIVSKQKNPIITPVGRDSCGRILFRRTKGARLTGGAQ